MCSRRTRPARHHSLTGSHLRPAGPVKPTGQACLCLQVDSSLPTLAGMTYNGPDCSQVSQQTNTDTLW